MVDIATLATLNLTPSGNMVTVSASVDIINRQVYAKNTAIHQATPPLRQPSAMWLHSGTVKKGNVYHVQMVAWLVNHATNVFSADQVILSTLSASDVSKIVEMV